MQVSKDLAAVSRYLRRQRNRYMEPLGLKSIHARFLLDICQEPGISQDGLAQRIGMDKSNVARQVALLEEGDFLYRQPAAQDKRMLCLYPTEKTRQLLPDLQQAMEKWEAALLQDLQEEEKILFARLLSRIRISAEREDGE